MKLELKKLTCLRCGWRWLPRTADVRTCPRCQSPFWDTPRETATGGKRT